MQNTQHYPAEPDGSDAQESSRCSAHSAKVKSSGASFYLYHCNSSTIDTVFADTMLRALLVHKVVQQMVSSVTCGLVSYQMRPEKPWGLAPWSPLPG